MTAALRLENVITEVGPGEITHAFFSTVSALLEPEGWGTRFPALMNKLYQGALPEADAAAALKEIEEVISALKDITVDRLVWDIEQKSLRPPSDYHGLCDKTNLYTYFRTLTGRNLAFEIKDNIEAQIEFGGLLEIISYRSIAETVR